MDQKIILFELNEVPFKVIEFFVKLRPQSTLARILPLASKYQTYSEDRGHLSPWVTWPTLHRGVTNEQHCIGDFGQPLKDVDQRFPSVWTLLARRGIGVGVGGSLHSYPPPDSFESYKFYIPDIFAQEPTCWPRELERFQKFCLDMARESPKNVSNKVSLKDAVNVLVDAPATGLRAQTMLGVAGQIVSERLQPWKVVRRRTTQSVLAFDVFLKQLRRTKPDFCTFFTNHVASAMHRYWLASFPEDYEEFALDADWRRTYAGEILHAMKHADLMLDALVDFVDQHEGYSLVITSSMGQHAVMTGAVETLTYATEPDKFLASLGVDRPQWEALPAMFPQLNVRIAEGSEAFCERLKGVRVAGAPLVFRQAADGFVSIDFGQENLGDGFQVTIEGRERAPADLGLANIAIQDKACVTAYHIPEGSMITYRKGARPAAGVPQVSTLDICPAILRNYAVEVPAYMSRSAALEL
jgi:hypothetical protein